MVKKELQSQAAKQEGTFDEQREKQRGGDGETNQNQALNCTEQTDGQQRGRAGEWVKQAIGTKESTCDEHWL